MNGIHILLTYRCTHACDHCFLHCGPHAPGTFTLDQVLRLLDQAVAANTVEWVFFEGGEPFLYHPVLLAGLAAARERGFKTGVVTNCYWAESEADAELWLRPLRGLVDELSLSDDAFHHGEEPDNPASRARRAAERLGLPVGAICIEEGTALLKGRAADELVAGRPLQPNDAFSECTDEELERPGRVHIDAWGHVHLCQGVVIGNVWETPLADIAAGYDAGSHPIAGPLVRGGPAALAREHGVEDAEEHASACHLCYRTRELLLERFPAELAPRQVYGLDS